MSLPVILGLAVGCTPTGPGSEGGATGASPSGVPGEASGSAPSSAQSSVSGETADACRAFFGDPDYAAPLLYDVMAAGAAAPTMAPGNDLFFTGTGDRVQEVFGDADPGVSDASRGVGDWLIDEGPRGAQADQETLRVALGDLAGECASSSPGAAWFEAEGFEAEGVAPGTKPATLVCSHLAVEPAFMGVFDNGNVLTSNLFDLVGLAPRRVDRADLPIIEEALGDLAFQRESVDDPGVAAALSSLETPLRDATEGDLDSPGLRPALTELATACDAAGYSGFIDVPAEDGSDGESEGELAGD